MRELCLLHGSAEAVDRARLVARVALVMDQCKHIIGQVSEASGASAHHLSDPLQRARRDAEMMATHMIFDLEMGLENAGRTMLGFAPLPPMT